MHTAMRIAREAIERIRAERPGLPVACFGLYAMHASEEADRVLVGETDAALVAWVEGDADDLVLHRGHDAAAAGAPLPARDLLPPLDQYVRLAVAGEERVVGSVSASHGCAHRCRHCPVPVVYDGRIRIVDVEAVLADAAQQVAAGARHLTFADPDFLNGARHSQRVVRALHDRFPHLTFDCTVKVEHILAHAEYWPEFAAAGCLFVVSAFESVDDATLRRIDKGHTTADAARAIALLREQGIEVRPSWMPFTPWTRLHDVQAMLEFVADHDLVANVDPVQFTIRLLLPEGSLLLGHPDLAPYLGAYDASRATYDWRAADPAMDELHERLAALVDASVRAGDDIPTVYNAVREACGLPPRAVSRDVAANRPRLTESWFCCAEPTTAQLGPIGRTGETSQSAT